MDEKEFKNILYAKNLLKDLLETVQTSDVERFKEIKGELKAMGSIISPLEMTMGLIVGAIAEYQRKTKMFEEKKESEDEETTKRKSAK